MKFFQAIQKPEVMTAIGTALAAIAALAAVGLSIYFYEVSERHIAEDREYKTQQLETQRQEQFDQVQDRLYSQYRSYLVLVVEHPGTMNKLGDSRVASYVLSTAESIFLEAADDKGWRQTARTMLSDNRKLIESINDYQCGSMNSGFVRFARCEAKVKISCADANTVPDPCGP